MTMAPPPANTPSSAAQPQPASGDRLDATRLRSLVVVNFAASVAFTAMYETQPILPQIGAEFHVSPAQAGLTLLSVTFGLAVASLGAGQLADRFGARRVMLICGAALTLFSILTPFAPTFAILVALRAAQGICIPGMTVAGLAYLHNELPAAWRGRVSGFYIAANTIGGLVSRLGVGLLVETIGWRGGLGLVAAWVALGVLQLLVISPARRHAADGEPAQGHIDPASAPEVGVVIRRLWWAPLIGATVFFPFLTIFSYSTFRLEGAPFNLSPTITSLIYLTYILGAIAAPIAGNLSDHVGRRPTIQVALVVCGVGMACSLAPSLVVVMLGLTLVCIGSLMAHVVANASVSQAANPLGAQARATALSLYTLGFYVGGGLGSFLPGLALVRYGWSGVVAMCAVAVVGAALVSLMTPARPEKSAPATIEAPTAG